MKRQVEKETFGIIRKELDRRLGQEISAYNDIDWIIKNRNYDKKTQPKYELCMLVLNVVRNRGRRHKSDDKYVSFSSVELRRLLGKDYHKIIDVCFDKKYPSVVVSMKKDKATLAYKLKDKVIDIVNSVYNDKSFISEHLTRGGLDVSQDNLPRYTILGSRQGGETYEYKRKKTISNIVRVNDVNIRILFSVYSDLIKKYVEGERIDVSDGVRLLKDFGWNLLDYKDKDKIRFVNALEERFNKIKVMLDHSHNLQIGVGNIIQQYIQVDSGRYFMKNDINLQTIPKEIRKIIMGGMGYYGYDINNCHYVILNQLNEMYGGEPLTFVKSYIKNTKGYREKFSRELNITIDLAKKILIMFIYGASIKRKDKYLKDERRSVNSAIIDDLNVYTDNDKAETDRLYELLIKNKNVMGLQNDVQRARELILDAKQHYIPYRGRDYLTNHFKRRTTLQKNGFNKTGGSKLSHILQGIESYIIDIVCEDDRKGVVMFLHDGWVSKSDKSIEYLEKIINNKMNYHFERLGYKGLMEFSVSKEELCDIEKTPKLISRMKRNVIMK